MWLCKHSGYLPTALASPLSLRIPSKEIYVRRVNPTLPVTEHSPEYKKHLCSANWKKFRKLAIEKANHRCEKCKISSGSLEVHHLNYDRLGREFLTDVQVVCPSCHPQADVERKRFLEARGLVRRDNAAFHTWMTKKYGEGYEYCDVEHEQFHEWLERKAEDCF